MDMTLAEQAREECRREIESACRVDLDPAVLAEFLDLFSGNFRRLCTDNGDGHKYWAKVGQLMRDNGRYIGTLAEFFAKNRRPKQVQVGDLYKALAIVRAECIEDRPRRAGASADGGIITPFFELCEGVRVDADTERAWRQFVAGDPRDPR